MKRFFLLAMVLVFTSVIYSQEIVVSTKLWSIMSEHCQPWGSSYSTSFFRFDGDTIIGGEDYSKVWIAEDEDHEIWNFYGAFIREEEGSVYYKELYGEEGLIYNFNLEIGDSVVVNNPRAPESISLVLSEIDSVELEDGYRERWKLESSTFPDNEYWIKGIGSQTGVINSSTNVFGGLCGAYSLLCEKENNELIYQNPEFGSCYLYTTDISANDDVELTNLFTLSYDNITKVMQLNMDDYGNRTVIISSITGNIITHELIDSNHYSFSFNEYPGGLYVISVLEERKFMAKKIIIN